VFIIAKHPTTNLPGFCPKEWPESGFIIFS
jgi:hypothetical protein